MTKKIIRHDDFLCTKCGKVWDITDLANMYREEGQNSQKQKDLEDEIEFLEIRLHYLSYELLKEERLFMVVNHKIWNSIFEHRKIIKERIEELTTKIKGEDYGK